MCLRDTEVRFRTANAHAVGRAAWRFGRIVALGAGLVLSSRAQLSTAGTATGSDTAPQIAVAQTGTPWRRVAGTTIDAGLAGAASGPVAAIWYAAGTGRLLVQTESSRIFETADFIHWRLNTDTSVPSLNTSAGSPVSLPEAGAKV